MDQNTASPISHLPCGLLNAARQDDKEPSKLAIPRSAVQAGSTPLKITHPVSIKHFAKVKKSSAQSLATAVVHKRATRVLQFGQEESTPTTPLQSVFMTIAHDEEPSSAMQDPAEERCTTPEPSVSAVPTQPPAMTRRTRYLSEDSLVPSELVGLQGSLFGADECDDGLFGVGSRDLLSMSSLHKENTRDTEMMSARYSFNFDLDEPLPCKAKQRSTSMASNWEWSRLSTHVVPQALC
eukprot:GFYU01001656.1.p1 GENE.GFYU01001656.1~~GFYU01001656.1.p1  ORF type:complete len:238 (+),score=40.65 GFYU01001656.1:179-892(+)